MPSVRISWSGIHIQTLSNPIAVSFLRSILFIDVEDIDLYLFVTALLLLFVALKQVHAFSRPPPVQRKRLPQRPTLQVLFYPDNITSQNQKIRSFERRKHDFDHRVEDDSSLEDEGSESNDTFINSSSQKDGQSISASTEKSDSKVPLTPQFIPSMDLPDSFAPLLSSSQMEILTDNLTPDLLHALHASGSLKLNPGRHEIPLNKDASRPQFILQVPPSGCKIAVVGTLGSDQFTTLDDLDPSIPTYQRSRSMVKHAGLVFDPPIPLHNVSPTLIHFPTLFEDNFIKSAKNNTFRRIRIVKLFLDWISSISDFIEKVLWIVESKFQIHLGKVSVTPLYKGRSSNSGSNNKNVKEQLSPNWSLSLAFSGHVLLFGYIPIPFVNITLPTFIIPHPHALLEYLATSQPLASAKLKKVEIEQQQRIALALIDIIETWTLDIQAVATPPALSVDWTLPGGLTVAVEAMHGRDFSSGSAREGGAEALADNGSVTIGNAKNNNSNLTESISLETLSTYPDHVQNTRHRRKNTNRNLKGQVVTQPRIFDSNSLVPWKVDVSVRGRVDTERITVRVVNFSASHDPSVSTSNAIDGSSPYIGFDSNNQETSSRSHISLSGSIVICKPDLATLQPDLSRSKNTIHPQTGTATESPTVSSILLFPTKHNSSHQTFSSHQQRHRRNNLLQYDYDFDINENTHIDAMSLTVGASHPMLKGSTIITSVLESIYAYGSFTAREGATMDMNELRRKRNILRHLPAVDVTAGIQNVFIPEESMSFSDDGQNKYFPKLDGGRMIVRFVGGFVDGADGDHHEGNGAGVNPIREENLINGFPDLDSLNSDDLNVTDGIKVVMDFCIESLILNSEANIKEFPELDIFDDQKLNTLLSGAINGRIGFHLRPQNLSKACLASNGIAPNLFNPLEAYEIHFSGSSVSLKIKEASATLGHRRIIIPTESTFGVSIVESVVDMAFDGRTQCECRWDFQGSSPVLQVTSVGKNPSTASHEDREQVNLLISSLRQGRFNLNVSSVGGLAVTQAATSRENREGLYDWKFFNAIVSPDDESPAHIMKVLHDRRTMNKLLQVIKLINVDMERLLHYILKQIWRAKEIFDQEGVSDPGKAIPGHKMARLFSLFLCGNVSKVEEILPLIKRVVSGEGLDVVRCKELLRKNLTFHEDWAPEIDRAVRWAEVMLGPMEAPKPYVENEVPPLCELPQYASRFSGIPSAKEVYATLFERRQLPLDPSFSNSVGRIVPYMSLRQVEYILHARPSSHWQPADLRRLRYVYAVKKKVMDISESYGGLSFLPQSFFVSIFVGEATRASLRASASILHHDCGSNQESNITVENMNSVAMSELRKKRMVAPTKIHPEADFPNLNEYGSSSALFLSPAGRVASQSNFIEYSRKDRGNYFRKMTKSKNSKRSADDGEDLYDVGDSLLGPHDVAILLQAGLTSSMKGSTVVQLNQRMLLDLMASQPRSFPVAVLAELGSPGGLVNPRGLTSALMALLDLDQSSFSEFHRLDMHSLLESWLGSGFKIPKRDDFLAGGRWARQSYYSALLGVARNILEDAEIYLAFKGHIQKVKHKKEKDPVPLPIEISSKSDDFGIDVDSPQFSESCNSKLFEAVNYAKKMIFEADREGNIAVTNLKERKLRSADCEMSKSAIKKYWKAFDACAEVLKLDKLAFHVDWFKKFYRRNYDALMVKSIYDNVVDDVDEVREWLDCLRRGSCLAKQKTVNESEGNKEDLPINLFLSLLLNADGRGGNHFNQGLNRPFFTNPEKYSEFDLINGIIDVIFFHESEREEIRNDPLTRLLISNRPGMYHFTIVTAMGVITEGKRGLELAAALDRLEKKRGVKTIRADTGTARSFEFNAGKIEEAIESAVKLNKPFGLLGYSQGCANGLTAESLLLSGSPLQQHMLSSHTNEGLVCRQLLFSAANGSMHGPAMEAKIHRLIVMCEEFFKYQQGYFSRGFITMVLETLTNIMDSPVFQKIICGGGGTFLHEGSRAFWREAQHLPHVPTCVLRGVLEDHTTPESLDMISNLLTKQAGSALHDSQVNVYDAVGHPVYTQNRNAKILKKCDMGGAVQRTHHWSPLSDEVEFVKTKRDIYQGSFLCAKDRHVFPWVDVNARFGVIKYGKDSKESD